jgi:ParB family chromosome partitioning protein
MHTLSIIENLQREDLKPIELAERMQSLIRDLNYSQDKVASQLGKDRSTVTNTLRLLELPEEIKKDVVSKKLSSGHARALLSLKDSPKIHFIRDQILAKKWSVRETEKKVKEAIKGSDKKSNPAATKTKDPNIKALEEQLSEHLGTPVEIWGETEGSIQISFKNVIDFNRIFNLILEKERDEDFE